MLLLIGGDLVDVSETITRLRSVKLPAELCGWPEHTLRWAGYELLADLMTSGMGKNRKKRFCAT